MRAQFSLRLLFTVTGMLASFLGGWRLMATDGAINTSGSWQSGTLVTVGLATAATVLIHGRWHIVPWFLASFVCFAQAVSMTFGWSNNGGINYPVTAICCGAAALVSSIVMIVRSNATSDSGHAAHGKFHRAVPWLSLLPAGFLIGAFARSLYLHFIEVGPYSVPFHRAVENVFPITSVLCLGIVLIHGSWQVVPWCMLGLGLSWLALAVISYAYGFQTQAAIYFDVTMLSCGPSALLGVIVLLQRRYRARPADIVY